MKRFICVLIVCLMVAPALAETVDDFNLYADMFGANDVSNGDARDDRIRFIQDGCTITFGLDGEEIISALIQGDGDPFLAYSLAAIMVHDPVSANVAHNGGQLLLYYLMCKDEPGDHLGQTVSGCYFQVERKENEGFSFMIMK